MEKILIADEEQYFIQCAVRNIGNIRRQYNSTWCNITNGEACDYWEKYNGESIHITDKPFQYPCILVYYTEHGASEFIHGTFIYKSDFNNEII
jgi:hypothetical protein